MQEKARVLLVCGAGASSQFIALRLRGRLAEHDPAISVTAIPLDLLPDQLSSSTAPALVYLGPHLAPQAAALRTSHPDSRVLVMTDAEYGDATGALPHQRIAAELHLIDPRSLRESTDHG